MPWDSGRQQSVDSRTMHLTDLRKTLGDLTRSHHHIDINRPRSIANHSWFDPDVPWALRKCAVLSYRQPCTNFLVRSCSVGASRSLRLCRLCIQATTCEPIAKTELIRLAFASCFASSCYFSLFNCFQKDWALPFSFSRPITRHRARVPRGRLSKENIICVSQ